VWAWLLLNGCFQPQEGPSGFQENIPRGFTARFEGVSYRQIRFDEERWLEGKARALNANPLKLKFDFEKTTGTVWLDKGGSYRDFDVNFLKLRGGNKQARWGNGGVVGLGTHQWLRLETALIDEKSLSLITNDTAWVVSPNMWLTSPEGLRADLPNAEVVTSGQVRLEAFDMKD
jgi:hypothetical protein